MHHDDTTKRRVFTLCLLCRRGSLLYKQGKKLTLQSSCEEHTANLISLALVMKLAVALHLESDDQRCERNNSINARESPFTERGACC